MWKHTVRKKLTVVMKVQYDSAEDLKGALEGIKQSMFCSCISAGEDGGNYNYDLVRVEISKTQRRKYGKGRKKVKKGRIKEGRTKEESESGISKVGANGEGN